MNHYNSSEDIWDIEISPKTSLFFLNFSELWRYRDLLALFVKRDFSAKYKQTILGPLWHFIQPLLTTIVSFVLFNVVANIGTNGQNRILFQMSGIIIWNYFSACLTATSTTFVTNARLFGKVYFPRMISPLSIVMSNLVQLGIQFILLVLAMLYFVIGGQQIYFGWSWILVPMFVFLLAVLALGIGIIISSFTTKYRDLSVLVTFGIQLLMFASAVNYPISELSSRLGSNNIFYSFVKYNPLTWLIDGFRNALLGGSINWVGVGYSAMVAFILLFAGVLLFNKVEKTFMDTV